MTKGQFKTAPGSHHDAASRMKHGGTLAPGFASGLMNASQSCVPFVEVVYDSTITEPMLRQLAELLPDLVTEAVTCPEEPKAGPPELGDLEIRFRPKVPLASAT